MSDNTNKEIKINISDETRKIIFTNIEECYKSDIKEAIQGKNVGDILVLLLKLCQKSQ